MNTKVKTKSSQYKHYIKKKNSNYKFSLAALAIVCYFH